MQRQAYEQWAAAHARAFDLNFAGEMDALLCWFGTLARYQPADLDAATAHLLASGETYRRVSEHLPALLDFLRRRQAEEAAAERAALDDDLGQCALCSSTGIVSVPHLAAIKDGQWQPLSAGRSARYYTAGVTCRCALGRHVRTHQDPDRRPLTLDEYAPHNPSWQAQLARRRAELLLEARAALDGRRAAGETTPLDDALDDVLERLRGHRPCRGYFFEEDTPS
jgi:hypothetical protein